MVLDSKQNRINTIAKGDIEVFTYISKGFNLRLEYENELQNTVGIFFYSHENKKRIIFMFIAHNSVSQMI